MHTADRHYNRGVELHAVTDKLALVYLPNSYAGRGPSESCAQIVSLYEAAGFKTEVMLIRARSPLPANLVSNEALPWYLRHVPLGAIRDIGIKSLDRQFIQRLGQLDPDSTIVDVWPGWSSPIIEEVKHLGFTVVRNMINCACSLSRSILDEAFERHGLAPTHGIFDYMVKAETEELRQYDYIVSTNAEVDRSLRAIGISDERILKSSFGWNPSRFERSVPEPKRTGVLRYLFVGSVGIRKGVPELLEAWRRASLPNAELLIIGDIEEDYEETFARSIAAGVRHLPYSSNIGGYYKSSDVFVFPTLEEGGPQVVYEAAGCGAAVITTPMGQARLVETDVNGIIVPPADARRLAEAMRRLSEDEALRLRLRHAAEEGAKAFTYARVGQQRAAMFKSVVDESRDRRGFAVAREKHRGARVSGRRSRRHPFDTIPGASLAPNS